MAPVSRRQLLKALGATMSLLTACTQAPAAAPAITAATPAPADWSQVVAAAKQEKTLVLSTHAGTGYEAWAAYVKKSLPELDVQATTMRSSEFTPRAVSEQRAGQYLWDLHVGPGGDVVRVWVPAQAMEPIKPFLDALPADVKADALWAGGFAIYSDPDTYSSLITSYATGGGWVVNRDVASAPELSKASDLLDDKWTGKILVYDPTNVNGGGQSVAGVLAQEGDQFVTKLVNSQLKYLDTTNQVTEWVAQGRYPAAFGADLTYLQNLQAQGVGKNVENVRVDEFVNSFGVTVMRKAPHPNAVKVFLNWFLSQDGQDSWANLSSVGGTTRRLDVKVYHPEVTPDLQNMGKYKYIAGTKVGDDIVSRTLAITRAHQS